MRAIVVSKYGGPEVLEHVPDLPTPVPASGEVLIDVAVSGVNYLDITHRAGFYPVPMPFVPGCEAGGTVAAVGPDVTDVRVGERVAWAMVGTVLTSTGGYAEQAVIPADRLVPLPHGMDIETAVAALMQGMAAHYLTHSVYAVQPGDAVLVHAAAGGVGLMLTQLVKELGGRVIGTVSTVEKEKLARDAGADETIRYGETDVASEIRRITGGEGVAVAYDSVGATTFDGSLASLRPRGMLALYGVASGPVTDFDTGRLAKGGSLYLTRPGIVDYIATREELLGRASDVFGWVASGTLKVHIGQRYALADARVAHEDLEGRRSTGKLLLIP